MYRLKANKSGKPKIVWQAKYPNSGIVKPSQVDAGSGTTPTNLTGGYVAITDNADPMNVVVYRTEKKLGKGEQRAVCKVPVFKQGASATENSLMGTKRSLIVENNYGYQDPFGPNSGARDQGRLRPRRHRQGRQGLHEEVDEPRRPLADRRAEALDQDRARSTPTRGPRTRPTRATSGRRSTTGPARPPGASTPARASSSTTTTPGSRSVPTGPPTSG